MKRSILPLLLLASFAATADTEPQEVQIPETVPPPLTNLVWKLSPKYATLEGDKLIVDIPTNAYPAEAVATADLPVELFAGAEGFSMTVSAEGAGLAKPTRSWLGLKFQVHWKENSSGREAWPNCRNVIGDFPETTLRNDASFGISHPDSVSIMLGLQGTSGRAVFDLSTLRFAPSSGLFRRINQDWIVRYSEPSAPGTTRVTSDETRVTSDDVSVASGELVARRSSLVSAAKRRTPLRGCMLPTRDTTEDDIETLHRWGATMARFQICRAFTRFDRNQDVDEYAAWVDSRLDNLEDVLRWAGERGMKICIDIHVAPGGRNEKDQELNMLHNDRFAEAWLDTWRRIATRFKGNPAIYGYDFINEPNQKGRARNDYWTLQRRAAEIVRAIDPDTPVIIESNNCDSAATFAYLSPLRMDNVIYQVHCYVPSQFTHQGINNYDLGTKWPDPEKGWNKAYIREALRPVREFQLRHHARIYVGEFSAIAWADGAENYLRDCIELFEEYGWDWTYHAFREWEGWSVEHEGPDGRHMVPSADNPRRRVLLDGLRGAIAPAPVDEQEVYVPAPEPAPLTNLVWELPGKYATLEGDKLVVDIPTNAYPAEAVATAKLPAELFEGAKGFLATVSAEGENLAKPTKTWLGLKFQMHWKETASGRELWPNCRNRIGDFSATILTNDASFGDARPDSIELQLGLQETAGRVVFDLSTLRGAPSQGFFRRINRGWIVRYPDETDAPPMTSAAEPRNDDALRAKYGMTNSANSSLPPAGGPIIAPQAPVTAAAGGPVTAAAGGPVTAAAGGPVIAAGGRTSFAPARRQPRRGVMLPSRDPTEEDFAALAAWGVTLVRYQMVRNWFGVGDNRDLDEFAAWLDGKLDCLDEVVLPCARKYGMKVVIDLHVTPGGRDASHEPVMFHEGKYADAFLDTWRRIATRFKGNADAIYGYDLVNEPFQHGRAQFDYWALQRRAAEAVREIDPDTPIVFEANDQDTPAGFIYLSPLAMDNVIYQVHCYAPPGFTHQGIGAFERGTKWPDPEKGWDKEYIRKALRPVREFQLRHRARIYVGEFSAIAWAEGADRYIADCIELFEEYGWDWTYHAFREWNGWSVEHDGPDAKHMVPSPDNPRKRALLDGFARGATAPTAPPPAPAPVSTPTPVTATYEVATDRPDAIYKCGDTATFTVTVLATNGVVAPDGTISVSLDNFGPKVFTNVVFDLSATNAFSISGTLGEPGFLRLVLPVNRDGPRPKGEPRVYSAAFEPEGIRKGSPSPVDFDKFWAAARSNLVATVPLDPQLTLLPDRSRGAFNFWRVSFATWGGTRVHGYLSIPKDASAERRYPVRFQVPAAGEGRWTCNMEGSPDEIRMLMTVHTFEPPFDLDALRECHDRLREELEAKYGNSSYTTAGLDVSREEYYFYRAILGIDRAVDWLAAREEVDPDRFTYAGTSQGGGFGLALMGLNHHFTGGALFVPAMTDTMGYLAGRQSGWPNPVFAPPKGSREARERNAPYFDGANFASRVRCPVRVAVGFSDTTCPPCAVYAAYNEIGVADKAILNGIGMTHDCRQAFYRELESWLREGPGARPAPPAAAPEQ